MRLSLLTSLTVCASTAVAQQIATDSGRSGPSLEVSHLYYDQFPTGFAMSKTGRMFTTYPASLYAKNINNYTLGELTGNRTERPYPNVQINSPPGGRVNHTTAPPSTVNYQNYLISVQGIIIDAMDRLWLLDNGRVIDPDSGTQLSASPGGPKLVGVDLRNKSVFQTIVFPSNVAYPDSYLNDFRVDLRPNITKSGKGVAYITDSSSTGHDGLVTVDLGTGEAWRHLDGDADVRPTRGHFLTVWGDPLYSVAGPGMPYSPDATGADGIALSADGETLFWSVTGSRNLYSIPTSRLRNHSTSSEVQAQADVRFLGEKGVSDGIETDSNNFVYCGSIENNAINIFNPQNASVSTFVRDPRIGWTDAIIGAPDGYLYIVENQLWRTPSYYPGTDRTVKPLVLFRVKIPNNGSRVALH